ncbi:MAG: transcriptional regulator, TetR family [Solirubrobacteraceae bacterium]|nr:transcriptional regulator, TetR family [Solirubrobacteraceae bacterium]
MPSMAATPTKQRILDSSGELFRRQGYMGTGIKEILAEAAAPFGSLYHHFPGGKEELGAETVRRSGRLYGALVGSFLGPEVDIAEGVSAAFAGAAETMRESSYADACPIATVALEASSSSEPLREACAEVFEEWIAGISARLELAGIDAARARELALELICALEGAFVLCRALRTPEPLQAAGAAVVASIRAALP